MRQISKSRSGYGATQWIHQQVEQKEQRIRLRPTVEKLADIPARQKRRPLRDTLYS
jgi:hypothetical protein